MARKAHSKYDRRDFLKTGAVAAAGVAALPAGRVWAKAAAPVAPVAESFAGQLFESLSPEQRKVIAFPWDHRTEDRGLLRTHVAANWHVTEPALMQDSYTDDQRHLVRKIMESIYSREWIERIDQQMLDDSGGWEYNSIALFGEPNNGGKFQFVMTGRHLTVRCDGDTAEHVALGGPIFYGHAADGFDEGPEHDGNVYWSQAEAANELYQMLDGRQRDLALVKQGLPRESRVGFRGAEGGFQGIPVTELAADQRSSLKGVLEKLVEPYRQTDRDEAYDCLAAQGGLDACHLAFFEEGDIGKDGVWDNWRLEGPSFVWHYRGAPHVHVWVNIADDPGVALNAG